MRAISTVGKYLRTKDVHFDNKSADKYGDYEVVSRIFRTGAAVYTAVVVSRSTFPNRPNCEFRVLLRRYTVNA
jgi:hypothetical protein